MREPSFMLLYMYVNILLVIPLPSRPTSFPSDMMSALYSRNQTQKRENRNWYQAVNASNRMRNLARSRSGSLDTLTSSIMSSSPVQGSPEKLGEGSRKSSLNTFTTPPLNNMNGGQESDEDGYVTAEDEETSRPGKRTSPDHASPTISTPTSTSTRPEQSAPMENASSSGIRGLMGRLRLWHSAFSCRCLVLYWLHHCLDPYIHTNCTIPFQS